MVEDDQANVYGPVPPEASAVARILSPLREAFTTAFGAAPSTAGTWRWAWLPCSVDGLQV